MVDVDIRLLRAFVAVAEELSFSRAAERLGLAQQGLSAQIRQLETRLDAKLFGRTTRRVSPTPAGDALLPYAKAAIAAVDAGAEAVRLSQAAAAGQVAVAGIDQAGELGEEVLAAFAARHPSIAVARLEAASPAEVLDEGSGQPAAVAFVRPPFRGVNRLSTVVLRDEPRLVALPAGHPLASREAVEAAELTGEAWAWAGPGDRVAEAFWMLDEHRGGRTPQLAGHVDSWDELVGLVAAGRAVGLVPETVAAARPDERVAYVPVAGIEPSRLALAWRAATETDAIRELAAAAREVATSAAASARR